jgi:hypothetical protein
MIVSSTQKQKGLNLAHVGFFSLSFPFSPAFLPLFLPFFIIRFTDKAQLPVQSARLVLSNLLAQKAAG